MTPEQSQRPQTLRYQSNTTFLIAPNASSVPGGSAQPALLQRSSQSTLTTANGGAWQSQSPQGLGTEQPAIAAVEASELLQVGSNTVIAPPPQPVRYAPATLRRSHMTTSLTEVSGVGGPGRIAAGGPFGPTGSSLSVPPVPSTSTVSAAPAVPGWARRVPPGTPLRRANMPASVTDAHGFGSSAGSTGSMTTPSRQPYFTTSMTEAPGSVAISSVRVIGCPSPGNGPNSMPSGLRPLRLPMRRSPSRRQQQSRPGPSGHRFSPPPPSEELGRRIPPGVDFREQERIDEGYESAEVVGVRQDQQPPLSHLPASSVDFRDREGTDDGYDSTETMSRQPPSRRRGPTRSSSARRQTNARSRSPPVVGSRSASGPRLSRIRMFHIEREFGTQAAEPETRNQPDNTQEYTAAPPPVPPSQPPSLSDIPDESTIDDYGPSRPRVCNCPGTVKIRRGPPCRSTSGRLRGAYIKNDDIDDDDDMDDLYMIKKSKKKSKKRQSPEPTPPPVAPTPSGGLMGFLSGLVGGRQPPPPPPPARHAGAHSDSDDESEYELRRFDRRQLENFVRKIDLKQTDDESKEGRKAKRKGEKKEEKKDDKKPEEKKPEEKAPEPEKKEEKPPEVKTEPAPAPMDGPLDVKVPVVFVFGGPGSGKGTQCDKIVQKYGFTHISSGDLLRAEVESGSDRGKEINEIMKKGELAPLAMILQLIKEAIKKNLEKAKGFLIDGYPRNVEQGERFEAEVCKCTNLVYFEVKDETMKARLLKRGQTSGRVDDNEETIAKRLKTFHDESEPVLEKYKDIVHKISAEDEPDKVFEAVTALFDEITKPK